MGHRLQIDGIIFREGKSISVDMKAQKRPKMGDVVYGRLHSTTKTHSFACRETDLERRIISCNDKSTKEGEIPKGPSINYVDLVRGGSGVAQKKIY